MLCIEDVCEGEMLRMSDAGQDGTRALLRRVPKQERSRERIDEILKVSMDLIGRKGIDAVTMKEIASLSGGPIASVYQYFPNKSAILATLYQRYADSVMELVEASATNVQTPEDAFDAIDRLVDLYYQRIRGNPAIQDLLNATQADKALALLDIEGSRLHSRIFAEAVCPLMDPDRCEEFQRTVFLMFQLAGSAVRLALLVDEEEGRCILSDFKLASKVQLRRFLPDRQGAGRPSS
ncbi:TetR/AcrR family transcriptional regulator [Pseudorhizobium endolithicum]|uniref:TetR/AcrR family transcriptional regulator n=2 Tax=Pseudorhizobium endolithicum TaxID=1191678 RepID=A0ABN7JYU2_9HYPH|nr:TetR/AcrR family transcriptional regulator [Pseudorhizobium endolithicum]